ncbi:MAG: ABC transporter permease subunit [Acidimicrobiia bacterium]|nr:ABC transporter permease subunit [Acidimicrobiia bacterium]
MLAAGAVALPLGLWLGHVRRGGFVALNLAGIGRAVPSLSILLLCAQWLGLEEWPLVGSVSAWLTLALLGLAPMLINSYVGMRDVAEPIRESAAAMGMTGFQQAGRVELPLAAPLVLAGLRTAAVQIIATATLAAWVGGGGLGRVDGFAVRDYAQVFGGAALISALALATDSVFSLATRSTLRRAGG